MQRQSQGHTHSASDEEEAVCGSEDAVILDRSPLGNLPCNTHAEEEMHQLAKAPKHRSTRVSIVSQRPSDSQLPGGKTKACRRSIINCSELPLHSGIGKLEDGNRDWAEPIAAPIEGEGEAGVSISS